MTVEEYIDNLKVLAKNAELRELAWRLRLRTDI